MPTNLLPSVPADKLPWRAIAAWGLLTFVMLSTHTRMATYHGKIAAGFQFEDLEQPTMMAEPD